MSFHCTTRYTCYSGGGGGGGGGGDYLSVKSCYYQVLIEVPRPTTARGIRLGKGGTYGGVGGL